MISFSENFVAEFAGILTTLLLHFVWQGAVLSLGLFAFVKLLAVKRVQHRYLLSVGTLLFMGMAPFVTVYFSLNGKSVPENTVGVASDHSNAIIETRSYAMVDEPAPAVTADSLDLDPPVVSFPRWNGKVEFYVLIVWLAGVLVLSTRLAVGFGVCLWIRRTLQPLSDHFEGRVRTLGDKLRINARNRVFVCMRVGQAVAVGFIRPIVLIPAAWLTQLTPEMLEAVIAHELAHIRRWDLCVNLGQRIIETLLFYHPAVWWLSRRIRLEREMCCDEIAVDCFDRAMYAKSLESVARIAHGNLLMAASINGGNKMNLLSRIRHLLGIAPAEESGNAWGAGFVAVILPFAVAAVFSMTAGIIPPVAVADETLDESKAAEKIELLGGKVTRNENLQDNPVISVVIDQNHRFSNKYLPLLKSFKKLTSISFWNVEITDESMKDLSDLNNLEVLEIGYHNAPSSIIGPIRTRITDVGLKELKGLTRLKKLYLHSAHITDTGLEQLSELKDLAELNLAATKITDSGLKELKVLKNLTSLDVGGNQTNGITDLGLRDLGQLNGLTNLNLSATRVTDAGLNELRELKNLKSLNLGFDGITGAGLKELSELNNLTDLNLVHCLVSDAGLKEIGKLKSLRSLRLSFSQITDAGLKELNELNNLTELVLRKTRVTDRGIRELKVSLPNAQILHDDPLPHAFGERPDDDTDESKAVEKIELLGGKVTREESLPGRPVIEVIFRRGRKITDDDMHLLRTLPSIRSVGLEMTQFTDAGLKELRELKFLTTLNLSQNPITNVGLKELSHLKNLTTLRLSNAGRITDDGLTEIQGLKSLTTLDLGYSQITDDGLKEIGRLKTLTTLNLCATKITDLGLKGLHDLQQLSNLELNGTGVTDAGMKDIQALKQLTTLNLGVTKITGGGLKELGELKNLTSLFLFNNQITDAGLIEISKFKNLTTLDLTSTQVTDVGLIEVSELKNLTTLNLSGNRITDVGVTEIKELKNLTELNLAATQIADEGMKEISGFTKLTTLNLSNTLITDVGMREIKELTNLTKLFLNGTTITDQSVKVIGGLNNLKWLYLSGMGGLADGRKITDESLKEIKNLKHLAILDLSGTQITDVGMKEISQLKNLTRLFLINTQITDDGLKEVMGLKNLESLVYSDFAIKGEGAKDLITDAGVKELKASLPKLETVRINVTRYPR